MEIFSVDSVIHLFNNGDQFALTEMAHHTSFRFGNLVLCKLNNLLRSLSIVDFFNGLFIQLDRLKWSG